MTIDLTLPVARGTDRPGSCVVAAVHPDSHLFDGVVERARAIAAETDGDLVFVSVATSQPLGHRFTRMRARLATVPHPMHLVATWVDGDRVVHDDLPALIAAEIVDAARRLGATAVVIGQDVARPTSPTGVAALVVRDLPDDIEACVGPVGSEGPLLVGH